jgi:hypothetical protein
LANIAVGLRQFEGDTRLPVLVETSSRGSFHVKRSLAAGIADLTMAPKKGKPPPEFDDPCLKDHTVVQHWKGKGFEDMALLKVLDQFLAACESAADRTPAHAVYRPPCGAFGRPQGQEHQGQASREGRQACKASHPRGNGFLDLDHPVGSAAT